VLHVAPMFHSADLVMSAAQLCGATQAYLPRFTPREFLRAIQDYRVTVSMLVPTMLIMTIEDGPRHGFDVSSLRHLIYGAASMAPAWLDRAMDFFPHVAFAQGYGLTETGPLLAILDFDSHRAALASPGAERLRSCGHPLPGVDLRIVDEAGSPVADGVAGELVVRGANVFGAYLNAPELNREAFHGGWFRTGDVGMVDNEGFVFILDRKKDVVMVGGESVYSGDVEAALQEHPDILECAVIGIPASRLGERVCAVLVCRAGMDLTRRQVRDWCRGRIGAFKIPTVVECVDALPRNSLGKVLKADLRERFASERE
jgi:long-chain acyl-CoA synthetase